MRLRALLVSAGSAALAVGTFFTGCNDDEATTAGGGSGADIGDVIFDMEGGDEALEDVLRAQPVEDPAQAPVIDAPAAGMAVPAAAPFTFRWRANASALRDGPAPLRFGWSPPPAAERAPGLVERFFSGLRSAHAHGPPVNGRAYFLVLATEGDPKLLRVFTQATEYTPSADAWARVTAASGTVTVTVLAAEMEANRVVQGGGPWQSAAVTFTVSGQ